MANSPSAKKSSEATEGKAALTTMAVLAPAVGWLIPGAGHLIQKRWIRGGLLLVSIATMFVLGLLMQGHVYQAQRRRHSRHSGIRRRRRRRRLVHSDPGDELGAGRYFARHGGLWNQVSDRGRTAELHQRGGCLSHCDWEKKQYPVTLALSRISAPPLFRRVCLDCVRHHPAQHFARADSLRRVLLRHVRGWSVRGRMGDVAAT